MYANKPHINETIINLLPNSKDNAIKLCDIASFTGCSYRLIKEIISELRKTYPICSKETDGGGYWIASNEDDIIEFIEMIEKHKAGYQNTIQRMHTHLQLHDKERKYDGV